MKMMLVYLYFIVNFILCSPISSSKYISNFLIAFLNKFIKYELFKYHVIYQIVLA